MESSGNGRPAKGSHLPCSNSFGWKNGRLATTSGSHTHHTHTPIHTYTYTKSRTHKHNTCYNTFLCKEWIHTPAIHSLLLLLAGDIETNPGPTQYPCPICSKSYSKRRGAILCAGCMGWVCYTKDCSGIANRRHVPQGWKCKRCIPGTTPQQDTNNNMHSQTGPTPLAGHVDTTTTASHSKFPNPIKNPPNPPLLYPRPPLLPTPPPSLFSIPTRRPSYPPLPSKLRPTLPLLHHPPYPPAPHPPPLHLPHSVLVGLYLIPSTFCR